MEMFKKTSLWRGSFDSEEFSEEADAVSMLREQLLDVRKRVLQLVKLIIRDVPGLTIHDVTHLDALWETASLIVGPNYPLNPAEAFVLGGAILLHDAAMSIAAYPDGLASIKQTPQWRDAVVSRLQFYPDKQINAATIESPPTEIAQEAIGEVLRALHAERARELALIEWRSDHGPEYLIQNVEMRQAYGSIIGKIAASHWWPTSELSALPTQVNAGPEVPSSWIVSPIKIACILRAADVAQVDHRRAPLFLRTVLSPTGPSQIHWTFQTKLAKPSIETNLLVYTGSPFTVNDADAWWLCYDMLNYADRELRATQAVLERNRLSAFQATNVKGANSPSVVAELIPADGWTPINTEIHVSDLPSLVELLGGEKLYGRDKRVPLRELMQNATDALRARRLLCEDHQEGGTIILRLRCANGCHWLDVEDDGIGMSAEVLTGALLDFGRSLWKSNLIKREFPGLLSKGLQTTGQFGIGFFSVFMLGDEVIVTTRRYDLGVADTYTLAFSNGLHSRPILREPFASEALATAGTRVSVKLRCPSDEPKGLLYEGKDPKGGKILWTLYDFVNHVCPASDARLVVEEMNGNKAEVGASEWKNMKPLAFLERIASSMEFNRIKKLAPNLRLITDATTGDVYGRAAIAPDALTLWSGKGMVTVGGFRECRISGIVGILRGITETVVRDHAVPIVSGPALRAWASDQAKLIQSVKMSGREKLGAARLVMALGGTCESLPIVMRNGEYMSFDALETVLRELIQVVVYDDDDVSYDEDFDDHVTRRDFERYFEADPELFLLKVGGPSFLTPTPAGNWPYSMPDLYVGNLPTTLEDAFLLAMQKLGDQPPITRKSSRLSATLQVTRSCGRFAFTIKIASRK